MQHDLPVMQLGRPVACPGEKFAQQKCLLGQPLGASIAGKKVDQFIAEHTGAARLEHNERHAGVDLWAQALAECW